MVSSLQPDDRARLVNGQTADRRVRLRIDQRAERPAQHHNVGRPRFLHVEGQVGNVESFPKMACHQLDNRLNRQREGRTPRLADTSPRRAAWSNITLEIPYVAMMSLDTSRLSSTVPGGGLIPNRLGVQSCDGARPAPAPWPLIIVSASCSLPPAAASLLPSATIGSGASVAAPV